MECVVINLDSKPARWLRVHAALNAIGMKHRRFAAIDGRTIGATYDHLLWPGTRAITPYSVLGCALSHYLVVQEFVEGSNDICLVLEDDAIVAEGCKTNLKRILAEAPPGWDMIKLASSCPYDGPNVLKKQTIAVDLVALLISRAGAGKILQQRIAWPSFADVTPWFIPNFNTYVVTKNLATFYQTFTDSSINGTRYPGRRLNTKVIRFGAVEILLGDVLALLVVALALVVRYAWKKVKRKRVLLRK